MPDSASSGLARSRPTASVIFVALLKPERHVGANALIHGSRALSFVAGPGLGGLLVQAPVAFGWLLPSPVPRFRRPAVTMHS